MNIVDSSGWLEYFSDGFNAEYYKQPLQNPSDLIVPSITIYEVFKVVLREADEKNALLSIAAMQKGTVVDLNPSIAINAAKLSLNHHLPMADSIILATAKKYDCLIWTQDSDFKNLPNVNYFPIKK